ncbi:MAG: hypothetical protein ACLS7Q_05830 [Varibaculum cambriense]
MAAELKTLPTAGKRQLGGKALVAAIRPSSLYYRFIRSSFAKKLEKIPGVEKVLTPRKEVSLPSLSLGLTEQEYQQLRTPLAPGSSEETTPALEGAGEFLEATRLGKVGLPQVGLELTDGTRLKDSQSLPLPAQSVEVPQPPRLPASPMPPEPPALPPQALDYTRRAPSPQNTEETRLRKGEDYDPNTP